MGLSAPLMVDAPPMDQQVNDPLPLVILLNGESPVGEMFRFCLVRE